MSVVHGWLGRKLAAMLAIVIIAVSFPGIVLAENGTAPVGPEICQTSGVELLFEFEYRMDYNDKQWIADLVVWGQDPAASTIVTVLVQPEGQPFYQLQGALPAGATLTFIFDANNLPDVFDIFVYADADLCFKPVYREYVEPAAQFNPPGTGAAADNSQACIKLKNPSKHPLCN